MNNIDNQYIFPTFVDLKLLDDKFYYMLKLKSYLNHIRNHVKTWSTI